MLSASHVVDAYPANTSESLAYGEALRPYRACVWLTGSCEGDVFLVVLLESVDIARYMFGVCGHCQIHVRSLVTLPDIYPFGVW